MSDTTTGIQEAIHQAASLLKSSKHAVVLTGAGLSTPSGIPDFRSQGSGLWTRYLPMQVASLTAFRHNPEFFFAWLHPLASHMLTAQPNPAHIALANLEQAGYLKTLITQNIDGLLSRAGAQNVLEIHGTLNTLTCVHCYQKVPAEKVIHSYIEEGKIPRCDRCGEILKPDVILFEEQLPVTTWRKAEQASQMCDLMLVAGTSLEVLPSAKLPVNALDKGASLIILNQAETYLDVRADLRIQGDVADILPRIAEEILNA